jgi:hypothetical protein
VNSSDVPEWTAVSAPDAAAPPAATTEAVDFEPGQSAGTSARRTEHRRREAVQALAHVASVLAGGHRPSPGGDPGDGLPGPVVPGTGSLPAGGGASSPGTAVGAPPTGGGGGGESFPPFHFPGNATMRELIRLMISAANRIDRNHYAYRWGGGHNANFSGPYDCSGAVSAVLHAAGLLSSPMVSGSFMHWGAPGSGAVTIYANAGHVYMSILGRFFGTSSANPGGGAGWFRGAPRPGFAVVHVPFSKLHVRKHRRSGGHQRRHRHRRHRHRHAPPASMLVTPVGGSGGGAAAPSAPATAPSPAPAPAPTAPAPTAPAPTAPAPTAPAQPAAAPTAPAPTAPAPTAPAVPTETQPTTSVPETTAATPVESTAPAPAPGAGSTPPAAGGDALSQPAETAPATPNPSTEAPATSGPVASEAPADTSVQQAPEPEPQAPQLPAGADTEPPASDAQGVSGGEAQAVPQPGQAEAAPPSDESAGAGAVTPSAGNGVQQGAGAQSTGETSTAGG